MAEILQMPGCQPVALAANEPVPGVVELLERYLEQAKRGEIRGVAIGSVMADGFARECWNTGFGVDFNVLLAAVTVMQYRMCKVGDDLSVEVPEKGAE